MAQKEDWNGWQSFGLSLGRTLRRLRKARGLTQDDLAARTGLTRNTISNIERNLGNAETPGDPRLSTIYRLARALDIPPAVLLPAGGDLVADICPPDAYGITLRWPADTPVQRFRPLYIDQGIGPRYEAIASRTLPEPPQPDPGPDGIDGADTPTE